LRHLGVGEADHSVALAVQEGRAVSVSLFSRGMGVPIDLDDQLLAETQDVRSERTDWGMVSPFELRERLLERTQKAALGRGCSSA
jgi:hypothetical protein